MNELKILSLRENPAMLDDFCDYFSKRWGHPDIYRDCMKHALETSFPLPQWFLIFQADEIVGGCGLITNDFISRMDLCPWLCALHVEEQHRHKGLGGKLIACAAEMAFALGFDSLYCCTDHVGFYEKYRFAYIGIGYHPWGETSRIYKLERP